MAGGLPVKGTEVGPQDLRSAAVEGVLPTTSQQDDSEHYELLHQVPHAEAVGDPPKQLVKRVQRLFVCIGVREAPEEYVFVGRMQSGRLPNVEVEPAL